jgi:very-short-patch-repair endonuclease
MEKVHRSTKQAAMLKAALEKRGIIVEAEKWDGHKHIDLVIHRARLNIEIDGKQHFESPQQIMSDLSRNHFSDVYGYSTIHIPNFICESPEDLAKSANALARVARIRSNKLGHRFHFHHYQENDRNTR